jgi:hypothetical protein
MSFVDADLRSSCRAAGGPSAFTAAACPGAAAAAGSSPSLSLYCAFAVDTADAAVADDALGTEMLLDPFSVEGAGLPSAELTDGTGTGGVGGFAQAGDPSSSAAAASASASGSSDAHERRRRQAVLVVGVLAGSGFLLAGFLLYSAFSRMPPLPVLEHDRRGAAGWTGGSGFGYSKTGGDVVNNGRTTAVQLVPKGASRARLGVMGASAGAGAGAGVSVVAGLGGGAAVGGDEVVYDFLAPDEGSGPTSYSSFDGGKRATGAVKKPFRFPT